VPHRPSAATAISLVIVVEAEGRRRASASTVTSDDFIDPSNAGEAAMLLTLIAAAIALPLLLSSVVAILKAMRALHQDSRNDRELRDYLDSLNRD
jgi:hypothetical protein